MSAFDVMAVRAIRSIEAADATARTAQQRLTTGLRLNSAADSSVDMAQYQRRQAILGGTEAARKNVQDGISLAQMMDARFGDIQESLLKMRDLAIKSGAAGLNDTQRAAINREISLHALDISETIRTTEWNGRAIFDGRHDSNNADVVGGTFQLQVGPNVGETRSINIAKLDMTVLGLHYIEDPTNPANSGKLLGAIDRAMENISSRRSEAGIATRILTGISERLGRQMESMTEAQGRLANTDVAKETTALAAANIKRDMAASMLAQANNSQGWVLKLLS